MEPTSSSPALRHEDLLAEMDWLRRLVRGLVDDPEVALEVEQEAWRTALERPPHTARDGAGLRAWLATVAARAVRHFGRDERRRRLRETEASAPERLASTYELVESYARRKLVVDAVWALDEPHKTTLILRYFEGVGAAEIAERCELSTAAVRQRLVRARLRLREELARLSSAEDEEWLGALLAPLSAPTAQEPAFVRRWVPWLAAAAGLALTVSLVMRSRYASPPATHGDPYDSNDPYYTPQPSSTPLVLAPVSFVPPNADDETAAWFSEVLGLELAAVDELPEVPDEQRERVAELTGLTLDQLAGAELFEARRTGAAALRVALVPIEDPAELDSAVLLALSESGPITACAVLDTSGAPVEEWEHFLDQMQFKVIPRLADASSYDALEQARARAVEDPDDGDAQLGLALIELMEAMQRQAKPFNLPGPGQRTAETFADMRDQYLRVAELAPALDSLLGEGRERFIELALASAEACAAAGAGTAEGDAEAARVGARVVTANCGSCHQMKGHAGEGDLTDLTSETRAALGLGDGLFRVGYDLRFRHADTERAQRIASAMRAGCLLLDGAAR